VPDVLIYAGTIDPAMRHEVPIGIPDPFLYVEAGGERHVVLTSFEIDRVNAIPGGPTPHPYEEFGYDALLGQGLTREEVYIRVAIAACKHFGVTEAAVPATFPAIFADRLREAGVTLTPEYDLFYGRRRVKSEVELAGMRRAQRAAEGGMDAARDLLRRASQNGAGLEVDGEPLTCEQIKAAIAEVFTRHGMTFDEFIVSHGAQAAVGHDMGSGPIHAGVPIVIDIWPRDNESFCFCDMTRTYVVGEVADDVREWHRLCKEALDRAVAEIKAGADGRAIYDGTCDIFEAAGEPTQRTKVPGKPLSEGFFHGLGHGVGLEVHEAPGMGLASKHSLVAGDVVTVEPGCYRQGYGGVRLEDLVLVTQNGAENLTQYPYDLAP